MADEKEKPRPDYSDPNRFILLKGGAVYGREEGRIVAHTQPKDGKNQLTTDRAKELVARRKQIGVLRQMRALARSVDIEVPDDIEPEQLEKLAGDGLEEIFLHMLKTFKDSKNLRGMAEAFAKIATGYLDSGRTDEEVELPQVNQTTILIAQFIQQLPKGETIGKKILEISEGDNG